MPTPKSPARNRLDELLADGEWHDREQLVRALMPLIPPGQAVRTARNDRAGARRRKGNPGAADARFSQARDDQTVGARSKASGAIANIVRLGVAERRVLAGVTQIRLVRGASYDPQARLGTTAP